jgi:hypothetical protein
MMCCTDEPRQVRSAAKLMKALRLSVLYADYRLPGTIVTESKIDSDHSQTNELLVVQYRYLLNNPGAHVTTAVTCITRPDKFNLVTRCQQCKRMNYSLIPAPLSLKSVLKDTRIRGLLF